MVVSSCFYPQLVQLVHLLWIPSSAGWVTDAILSEPWKDWISGEICRGNTDFLFASSKPLGETQKQLKFPSSPDPCPTRLGSVKPKKGSAPHIGSRWSTIYQVYLWPSKSKLQNSTNWLRSKNTTRNCMKWLVLQPQDGTEGQSHYWMWQLVLQGDGKQSFLNIEQGWSVLISLDALKQSVHCFTRLSAIQRVAQLAPWPQAEVKGADVFSTKRWKERRNHKRQHSLSMFIMFGCFLNLFGSSLVIVSHFLS